MDRALESGHKFADSADKMRIAPADAREVTLDDELLGASVLLLAATTVELFGSAQRMADVIALLEMFDEPDVPPSGMGRDTDATSIFHGVDQLSATQMHVLQIELAQNFLIHAIAQDVSTVGICLGPLENAD